jgi:hypothetical protein
VTKRLPTLVVQQYISLRRVNQTPPGLSHLKPKEGIQRAGALLGVEHTPAHAARAVATHEDMNRGLSHHCAFLKCIFQQQYKLFHSCADWRSAAVSLQDAFGDEPSGDVSSTLARASAAGGSSSAFSRSLHSDGTHSEDEDAAPSAGRNASGPHVIILQHGFKGTAYDMRLLRNCISALFPDNTHVS